MNNYKAVVRTVVSVATMTVPLASLTLAQSAPWLTQTGTAAHDALYALCADQSGGFYAGGYTSAALFGPHFGAWDAWVSRHDSDGSVVWSKQFGGPSSELAIAIAPDGVGGLFVPVFGTGNIGLCRFDAAGVEQWSIDFGTTSSDSPRGAAYDGFGGVYLGGDTEGNLAAPSQGSGDAWIARVDAGGTRLWTRQLGSTGSDAVNCVVADGVGGCFVAGYTEGDFGATNLGSTDVWFARYDGSGAQLWIRQIGSPSSEWPYSMDTDGAGGFYMCGDTGQNLGGTSLGGTDAWVARFDSTGALLWIRQLGSSASEAAMSVSYDGSTGVYISGYTLGGIGRTNLGGYDAWIGKFDSLGNELWTRQLGTTGTEFAQSSVSLGVGKIIVGGSTDGAMQGANHGGRDAWIGSFGSIACFPDVDLDGFGSGTSAHFFYPCPSGQAEIGTDCDDDDHGVFPGAPESCNGVDDNCDGTIDEGFISTYCTAGTTVHGCVPSITGEGAPSSIAPTGFDIVVRNVPGERYGTVFYGFYPFTTPWAPGSTSYKCIANPVTRTGVFNSGGTAGQCNGELHIDFNAWMQANPTALGSPFVAGQVFYAQGWLRDPAAPKQTNLSNGLRFTLCE